MTNDALRTILPIAGWSEDPARGRQATASLRSGHYVKMDGAPVSTERNTVIEHKPAREDYGSGRAQHRPRRRP